MKIVMSSGHGKYVAGAAGPSPWGLQEHPEAVRVVDQTAIELRNLGVEVVTYEDTVSHTQDENLKRIVDFHNSHTRDIDISIHFNCNVPTENPVGCEMLYISQAGLEIADEMVDAVCTASGLKNRGAKERDGLYFLKYTEMPSVLAEMLFVDSHADVKIYNARFNDICTALAAGIAGTDVAPEPTPPDDGVLFSASGTCSTFGGPYDTGVSASEGLAFIYNLDEAPYLFLSQQPPGTSGLARRLDPAVFYLACRWNYDVTSKEMLATSGQMALVTAKKTGIARLAHPADWGPHEEQTGRAADLSPGLAENLGVSTDDLVEVIYPYLP